MGEWGTAIDENDTYLDVKSEFEELYNKGKDLNDIYKEFISEDDFDIDAEETYEWWFAIADMLWHYKILDKKVYTFIKKIIESKKDLTNFLNKISKPKKGEIGFKVEDFDIETQSIESPHAPATL